MSLQIQPLTHYSDFDGTSESEASEISIVLPYASRFRNKKHSQPSEGQIRQKKGARATRRYENDAYLTTLAMITEVSGESEVDYHWDDSADFDSGFKRLFIDADIRELWDAFISLSEKKQVELLGSLASHSKFDYEDSDVDKDVDMGDDLSTHPPPTNYNNTNRSNNWNHHRRGNKGRSRRRPVVRLEPIYEDDAETYVDAFEVLRNLEDFDIPFESRIPLGMKALSPNSPGVPDADDTSSPSPGTISSKFMNFIRNAVKEQQHVQNRTDGDQKIVHKKRRFCVQDLCLIHRVEAELRKAFGLTRPPPRVWTPTTSLLTASLPSDGNKQQGVWVRGHPLVLNGFQRMLVHATATYLGLHSFSSWNESLLERQLWVNKRRPQFHPPEQPFLTVIKATMEKLLAGQS